VPQPAFAEGFGGRAGKRAERFRASRSVPVILQAASHHRRAASAWWPALEPPPTRRGSDRASAQAAFPARG